MTNEKVRVLVVGQTPPPFHGQALMIDKLIHAKFEELEIIHLRMAFSSTMQQVGKFQWKKIFHLFRLLITGLKLAKREKIGVLYYPPAGPQLVPILRDILLLPFLRLSIPSVVYHFRAGGISEYLRRHRLLASVAKLAYGKPDVSIVLSQYNPSDAHFFQSKQVFVIPNGLEDTFEPENVDREHPDVRLFYIGLLSETKGLLVLLDAFRQVLANNPKATLHLAGEFPNVQEQEKFNSRVDEFCIGNMLTLYGSVMDDRKWGLFSKMDVLCFLTHYPAETFGNCVLEGMIWELPVVATAWRGVQDLVIDNETGFLVPTNNPDAAAEKLMRLALDSDLRRKLGKNGRKRFLKEFTLEKHLQGVKSAILSASARD